MSKLISELSLEEAKESLFKSKNWSRGTEKRYDQIFENQVLSYWAREEKLKNLDLSETLGDFKQYIRNQGYSESTVSKAGRFMKYLGNISDEKVIAVDFE